MLRRATILKGQHHYTLSNYFHSALQISGVEPAGKAPGILAMSLYKLQVSVKHNYEPLPFDVHIGVPGWFRDTPLVHTQYRLQGSAVMWSVSTLSTNN